MPERERGEQDRHRALEPAPGDERALAVPQPRRQQQRPRRRAGRITNASTRREQQARRASTSPPSAEIEIVSPSATKTTISASDESASWKTSLSGLERRADVADEQAGDEDGEEARAAGDGGDAVDHARAGERAQRVEAGARQRERASARRASSSPPATPTASPIAICTENSRTTIQALPPGCVGELDHPDHQRDPDRVVRARLALEDRPRAAADLAVAEHREHHRRVGRRDGGAEQAGGGPVEPDHVVRDERRARRGRERADDAEQADRDGASRGSAASRSRGRRRRGSRSARRVATRITVSFETTSRGKMSDATAAATRNGAAAGTEMRSLSLLAKSAATRPAATSRIPPPKVVTSSTTADRIAAPRRPERRIVDAMALRPRSRPGCKNS